MMNQHQISGETWKKLLGNSEMLTIVYGNNALKKTAFQVDQTFQRRL